MKTSRDYFKLKKPQLLFYLLKITIQAKHFIEQNFNISNQKYSSSDLSKK